MKDTILIEYTLNEENWRQFFTAHYQRQTSLRLRYVYGLVLLVSGAYLAGGPPDSPWLGAAFVATGLYAVLSKQLLVLKSMAAVRRGPMFGARMAVSFNPQGLKARSGKQTSERPWNAFRGYCLVKPGVMLYLDQTNFFFIPREALTEATAAILQRFLEQAGLKRL